jgi:hypothetical protein
MVVNGGGVNAASVLLFSRELDLRSLVTGDVAGLVCLPGIDGKYVSGFLGEES